VINFPLLTQCFSVVAGQDDDGPVHEAGVLEPADETSNLAVHKGYLAIVRMFLEFFAKWCWWSVGEVGIIKMHPGEKPFLAIGLKPVEKR